MSIRTKLLVLLLGLALGSMGLSALFTIAGTSRFARDVSEQTREVLESRGERELTLAAGGFRRIMAGQKWAAELALLSLSDDARQRLVRGVDHPDDRDRVDAEPSRVVFAGDVDPVAASSRAFDPLPARYAALFRETRAVGDVVFHAPPDADREAVERHAHALAGIEQALRSLDRSEPAIAGSLGLRSVALESGLLLTYPGLLSFPEVFDARLTPWYRAARRFASAPSRVAAAEGPVLWNRLYTDPVTDRVVMTAAMPILTDDGAFLGAAAIDIPIQSSLARLIPAGELGQNSSTKLVVPIPPDVTDAERRDFEEKVRVRTGGVTAEDRRLIDNGGIMVIAARYPADPDEIVGAPDLPPEAVPSIVGAAPELLDVERIIADGPQAQSVRDLVSAMLTEGEGVALLDTGRGLRMWAWGALDKDTYVTVDVPYAELVDQSEQLSEVIDDEADRRLRTFALVAVGLAAAAALLAIVASNRLVRPLLELRGVAERVAAGDFEARANITTGDEIERLGRTFNDMVPQLADRMRLRESITVAQQVQQHLLPTRPPELPGLEIGARSVYCDETGGDYFDFVELNGDARPRTVVAVGDVTGHGIAAALVMASARAILRSRTAIDDDLARVAAAMNEQLFRDSLAGRFMTLFAVEIDRDTGTLRWVSAGHEPALLYDPDADTFEELRGADIPLGIESGWVFRCASRGPLRPRQVVVIGTDGIWETRGPDGELFGRERFCEIIRAHAADPIETLQEAVDRAIRAHRGHRPQQDDVTLVIIRACPVDPSADPSEYVTTDVDRPDALPA